ncbi:LacI family DNA-binding transcriptional regulator [Nonomuraea sp. NPDC049421]|uniref:LacI family DNA-binding transcriptional regulator n=1 Tax=Nonomuraea sp. NPDC049421 TaxID=3155275 RepID=UPI00341F6E62
MPTLADVAVLAGVSKATASRALGRPDLAAPETVARVRAAAEQLGFVPNRAATQLARGRTGVVAIVVPTLDNTFFTPIIGGAQARAAGSGMQLTIAVHSLEHTAQLAAVEQLAHQVDGFLFAAPRGTDEIVRAAASYKPTVLIDREIDGMPSTVADTATAFGALIGWFAEKGHEHIVYIGGPAGSWQDGQRQAAIRAAASASGATLTMLGPYPSTFASGVATAEAVVAARATAVVPYATSIGLGLMFALMRRGVTDVVVSSEGMVVESLGLHDVPSIDVDGEKLGEVAMDQLMTLLGERRTPAVPTRHRLTVPIS